MDKELNKGKSEDANKFFGSEKLTDPEAERRKKIAEQMEEDRQLLKNPEEWSKGKHKGRRGQKPKKYPG